MKFCLDEQMSRRVAEQLRKKGCDAIAITETHLGHRNTPDEAVLSWAILERRALVTYNIHDFAPLMAQMYALGREHWGVILISERSIPQAEIGRQVSALRRLASRYPGQDDLQNITLFLETNEGRR